MSQLTNKEEMFIESIKERIKKITPGPYKIRNWQDKGIRYDCIREADENYIVLHTHKTAPLADVNPNWENDCLFFIESEKNQKGLLEIIERLIGENSNGQ